MTATNAATVEREAWIVGATSILGWTLAKTKLAGLRITPICNRNSRAPQTREWPRINVEDPSDWDALRERPPAIVIYAAGICDVERCAAEPERAWSINLGGVTALLDALPSTTRLVVCSSDHVFAGRSAPYLESTPPDPISVYGHTRVAAEQLVRARRPEALVVRVALPIGPSMNGRVGHLDWLRYRHARGLPMTIVEGEHRAAVWAHHAAKRILALAQSQVAGIRHLASTRPSGRPELAAWLCRRLELDPAYEVVPRSALDHPHLGRVDLRTEHDGPLASPLPAVLDG